MTLDEVARLIRCEVSTGGGTPVVSVTEDSRRVAPGCVFVAVRGEHSDGHAYARQAVEAGAVAIAGDRADTAELEGVPYLAVAKPRAALGLVAHALTGNPTERMTVLGVTGTNGKSSTVCMVRQILEACGRPAAAFGTLGCAIGDETIPAPHTTPFGEDLAPMFRRAADKGIAHVVMEVSSHALQQGRVEGIDFDVAAFTNLTQDHLDYHHTMDEYLRAKLLLFERLSGTERFGVVNLDDPSAPAFLEASSVRTLTYGAEGDCRASDVQIGTRETRFVLETPWGKADAVLNLLGHHNVTNALCAVAMCGGLGVPLTDIVAGLAALESVPGRFEHVDARQPFQVIVDYAHTDDGLKNVLNAARAMCRGRVITVFGCGGDRDKGKRPKMAAVSAALSDFTIITSDNPRTEDPGEIIKDIEAGMTADGKQPGVDYVVVPDRTEAIRHGIETADAGDLVMIAGKGHEDYQILGTTRIHYDDREVALKCLQEKD